MKFKSIVSASVAALFIAAPGMAATINIADGSVGCESKSLLSDASSCVSGGNADLGQNPNNHAVNFQGTTGTLLGFVRDAEGNAGLYADRAQVTLSNDSMVKFTIMEYTRLFDATLSFGGIAITNAVMDASQTMVSFFASAGTYAFSFDANNPNQPDDNTSDSAMEISAVPLPAGLPLLLVGLGSLGLMRRKRKAA